jgi:hypothetical protein
MILVEEKFSAASNIQGRLIFDSELGFDTEES